MLVGNGDAVFHLTRLYLPGMVARRRGYILILASTASFQAVPYISTHAATKAFDLLFAEGLAEEMKPYGIRVCALRPGSTESEFHVVSGQEKFRRRTETAERLRTRDCRLWLRAKDLRKRVTSPERFAGLARYSLALRSLVRQ